LNNSHRIDASYGGVELQLQISTDGEAILLVNGIARDKSTGKKTLLVTSTVQTDYEWHELIEGKVLFSPEYISAALYANKVQLVHQKFPTKG